MNHETTKVRKREMPKTHQLKTWPDVFEDMWQGVKEFDYRKDDRGFKVGDVLHLREWDPETQEYTGRGLLSLVTYILCGGQFGIPPVYKIMGLKQTAKLEFG